MNHGDSGLAHGTGGSPQLTIENQEMAEKAKENEVNVKKCIRVVEHIRSLLI